MGGGERLFEFDWEEERVGAYSRLGAYSNKYGIYLDTATFVMRSVFVVLETTCPQI